MESKAKQSYFIILPSMVNVSLKISSHSNADLQSLKKNPSKEKPGIWDTEETWFT